MRELSKWLFLLALLFAANLLPAQNAGTNAFPPFDEIYQLLKSNLSGITPEELDRAAVKGLLSELQSRVMLLTNDADFGLIQEIPVLSRTTVYDTAYGYLRIGRVGRELNEEIGTAWSGLSMTNKIKGLVLDLRFATGTNYAAAAAVADRFVETAQPLLSWENNSVRATAKPDAIKVPLAILINQQTSGAAEALAGLLREVRAGLLIGAPTSGQASTYRDFVLAKGQRVRIATGAVTVGNGKPLPAQGLKPDLQVQISLEDEKAYFEDPYRVLPRPATHLSSASTGPVSTGDGAGTNRVTRRRINEAELVRLQREGLPPDSELTGRVTRESESGRVIINDPALTRALDLLKGLSLVQPARSI